MYAHSVEPDILTQPMRRFHQTWIYLSSRVASLFTVRNFETDIRFVGSGGKGRNGKGTLRYWPITFQGGLSLLIGSMLFYDSMDTLDEKQPWGITKYLINPGSHVILHTEKAKIDLITNPHFGRMLFIDNILQCAEVDEHIYHQALVSLANPHRKVLILGGAEGATAREVFRFPDVETVDMVDWDEALVNHMKTESFSKGAFQNPNLTIFYTDAMEFLTTCKRVYHSIIVDLLDPQDSHENQWLSAICHLAFTHLAFGGTLSVNAGGDYKRACELIELVSKGGLYEYRMVDRFVPSFQESWYLIRFRRRV
jgi:spermidine synthase